MSRLLSRISFHIQRRSHHIQLRNFLSAVHRIFLPGPKTHSGLNTLNIAKSENAMLTDLTNDGFSDLGIILTEQQITLIKDKLKTIKCFDTGKKNLPEIDPSKPNDDTQLGYYMRDDLKKFPEIMAIANDSKVLNVVSKYLGVNPTISNINCWWSFGYREAAQEAQFYHRDLDDYKFVKLFFYLTDVNEDNGPHIYVKGSHKVNRLIELRRFTDKEVEETFSSDKILNLKKPQGSCFLEDTYGIHKGQLPITGNRLLLQIQYSYMPIFVENYKPEKSNLSKDFSIDSYINRLLFN